MMTARNHKEGTFMTITIDTTRCIGCGMCAYAAPQVFRVVGKYSTVLALPDPKDTKVLDAANGCPVNAILIQH
jgi:ferredoxin